MHGTPSALLFRARQARPALRWALGLSLLLGAAPAAPARAADPGDAAELLGKLRDEREACDAKLDALRAAQAAQPAALQPAFALADCLYENGRHQVARELLDPVWRGQSPAQAKAALGDRADEGIALYAILLAHGGRGAEATTTLQAAEAALGPRPHLQRARLLGRAYAGDKAGSWRELDALLAAHPAELPYLMAAAELASIDPDGISAPARAVIGMRATPNSRYNRAARQFSDGAPRACVDSVRQALPELPPAEAPRFLSLGYRCAVQAEDTAAAAAMLKQLGPTGAKALPADALLVHARLLVDAGEGATGVRLLGLVQPENAAQAGLAQTIRVRVATEAGDLGAALAAADASASPASRANLGRKLVEAGRAAEATPLIEGACAELKGESAKQCYEYLTWLKKQTK